MIAVATIPPLPDRAKEKFWNTVEKSSDCWLWKGLRCKGGYGKFWFSPRGSRRQLTVRAHRVSFILSEGTFENGPLVLHKCRNRNCVNPAHLYAGTQKQNIADKKRDGTEVNNFRVMRGTSNGNSKLTNDDVRTMRDIRTRTGASYVTLGKQFGVTSVMACDICRRKYWKHIE